MKNTDDWIWALVAGFVVSALLLVSESAHGSCNAVTTVHSFHKDRTGGFREDNWGLGAECPLADNWHVIGGGYENSIRERSFYTGAMYLPWKHGSWSFGGVGGVISGYTTKQKFTILSVPLVKYETATWGFNLLVVPEVVVGIQLTWHLP